MFMVTLRSSWLFYGEWMSNGMSARLAVRRVLFNNTISKGTCYWIMLKMSVPTSCGICLKIEEDCELVWRIANIPPTQFIREIFHIEVEPERCVVCKSCERELINFYVFYKMVRDAHRKNFCSLEGVYLVQEQMGTKQEGYNQQNDASEQHIKQESSESEHVTFDMGFEYMDTDFEEVDVKNKASNVSKNSTVTNKEKIIDTSMRPFDVKKEALAEKSRHEQATKTFLEKYSLNQIYENEKWLVNDEQKKEIISWFVDMKCNFAVCSALANFENLSDLEQHAMSIHQSYPNLFCCDEVYKAYSHLEAHVLNKHLLKNKKLASSYVACDVCGKSVLKYNMKHHLYRHLPNDKRDIQCDKCDARFMSKTFLKYHLETIHSTQSVPCDICGKTFKNKNSMKVHQQRHTKKKFHLCPECGKKIESPYHFKEHMDEHYGKEVKVKCEICNKVVKQTGLRTHMDTHDPEKIRQCPHCPYKTSRNLNAHVRKVHEKIKPHTCSMCPMKFYNTKAMKDHMSSRHTGIPRYNCPFCDKTFMHSGNFFTHKKRMHPKELAENKLKMAEKIGSLPVGKLISRRLTILEGEASAVLESKLISTKTNKI